MRRAACLVIALVLAANPAFGCEFDGRKLDLRDTKEAFGEIKSQLERGLTVTIWHTVLQKGKEVATLACRVYYDLWEESHSIEILAGAERRSTKEKEAARLDELCYTLRFEGKSEDLLVRTTLDPVSDEQMKKTRAWLAERGIGESAGALGRAVGAFVDLKQKKVFDRRCSSRPRATP